MMWLSQKAKRLTAKFAEITNTITQFCIDCAFKTHFAVNQPFRSPYLFYAFEIQSVFTTAIAAS